MMDFIIRDKVDTDDPFIVSTWLYSYGRSKAAAALGVRQRRPRANEPESLSKGPSNAEEAEACLIAGNAWRKYWATHHPIIESLVHGASFQVACDPMDHDVVYGWKCHTGDTLHYILCKHDVHRLSAEKDERGLWFVTTGTSGAIVRALLGDMLERPTGYTHELMDMRRPQLRAQGVTIPSSWYVDTQFAWRDE